MGWVVIIGFLVLIFAAKENPLAALIVLIVVISVVGIVHANNERARKQKDEDESIAAEEARQARLKEAREAETARQKAAEEARQRLYRESQREYYNQIILSGEQALSLFESLPKYLIAAENLLDQAKADFSENAFAPFWDSIEKATNMLGRYDEGIRHINNNLSRYNELIKKYDGQPQEFPLASQSVAKLSVGTATADRMKSIVKNAQRNFQFAMIYEQRKTNQILVAGFTSLAQALDQMTYQITTSINDLAGSVDVMTSTINESTRETHAQYVAIAETNNQYLDELRKDAAERSDREEKALEMLDNIQRHRKPRY